jgi:phosphoribosyl-ATP pyrophosphohydrolase
MQIITELSKTIKARLKADPKKSYVALLHDKGLNKILEKISEESTEVILAAKDTVETENDKEHVTEEVADLWFHCMVLLTHLDIEPEDVLKILENRFGEGGLVEKAKRTSPK